MIAPRLARLLDLVYPEPDLLSTAEAFERAHHDDVPRLALEAVDAERILARIRWAMVVYRGAVPRLLVAGAARSPRPRGRATARPAAAMSDPLTGVFGSEYADVSVPVVVRLDTVAPEPVQWLWPDRLPRGKLTLLIGDPGLGKTFLLLDLMARVSRAAPWPDAGTASLGASVLLTSEDGLADTIRPRLEALEADCGRIHALTAIREAGQERPVSLAHDLAQLEGVIERTQAGLVGVDPLSAYLGDRDSYKDPDIRRVLGPVAALAERTRSAIVGIMHLTKTSSGGPSIGRSGPWPLSRRPGSSWRWARTPRTRPGAWSSPSRTT